MKRTFYRLLSLSGRLLGAWFFLLVSRTIAAGYFVISPKRSESCRFYALLYPARSRWHHLWCTFRQYQNFTTIHFDRFLATGRKQKTTCVSHGWERLAEVIGTRGGILLMSHLGNWELAAHLLQRQKEGLSMLLYMGVKEKEGVERQQKQDLLRAGIRIVGVDREDASPFSVLESIKHLQQGGLVSLSGDVVWQKDQRQVEVDFLGGRAFLPAAPFVLALVSGAPLFAFFSFRIGKNSYELNLSEPISIDPRSRADRDRAIGAAAQHYAVLLEQAVRNHPLEWYHFERFVH